MGNRKQRGKTENKSTALSLRPLADGTTSLAIGLVAAALLSSLAAAGLNTLTVARVLLGAACTIGLLFISKSQSLSAWSLRKKVIAALALTAFLVVTERVESHSQPKARQLPRPPLMLMIRPMNFRQLTTANLTPLKTLPLALGPIARPEGGYPAFNLDNDKDQVMFGLEYVTFYNMAQKPLEIDARLEVDGPAAHMRLPGDGRGAGVSQLNENDWLSLQQQREVRPVKLQWMLTPMTVAPQSTVEGHMAFVVPADVSDELRQMIVDNKLSEGYRYQLVLRERISGASEAIKLPFGK